MLLLQSSHSLSISTPLLHLRRPALSPPRGAPVAVVPAFLPPAVAGVVAVLGFRQVLKQDEDPEMQWYAPQDESDPDSCLLIGEEVAEDGKTWYVCSDKQTGSEADCSKDVSLGSEDWVCKVPKGAALS